VGEVKKPYPQNQEDIMYIIVLVLEILEKKFIIGVIQHYILDTPKMGRQGMMEMTVDKVLLLLLEVITVHPKLTMELLTELM
jgi:hypothetical protein